MRQRASKMAMALFVPALLIAALAGCDGKPLGRSSLPTPQPTATATPSPTPVPAPPLVAAAPTSGWADYRDRQYPFHIPVPPDWRPDSMTTTTPGTNNTYYIAQFFPPQSHGSASVEATTTEPELIEIAIVAAAPYVSVADDPSWRAEAQQVAVGNTQSTLFDRSSGQQVDRVTQARHGALQFTFRLHVATASGSASLDTATINRDTSLYLGMLHGFQVTTS